MRSLPIFPSSIIAYSDKDMCWSKIPDIIPPGLSDFIQSNFLTRCRVGTITCARHEAALAVAQSQFEHIRGHHALLRRQLELNLGWRFAKAIQHSSITLPASSTRDLVRSLAFRHI